MSDPLLLFREAADSLRRTDWHAVADLCDPASLLGFKREQLEMLECAISQGELAVEDIMHREPDMPVAAAEYYLARARKYHDRADWLQRYLPGVHSAQQLREMHPVEVFAIWLRGRSIRYQIELLASEGQAPAEALDELAEVTREGPQLEVVGAVQDGERLIHIVYRQVSRRSRSSDVDVESLVRQRGLSPEEGDLARDLYGRESPQIATCRRQPDEQWRLIAGRDFLGLGPEGYFYGDLSITMVEDEK